MAYDGRKIANSFYLPKRPFLRGIASLMDFTGSATREYTEELLARSDADAMRADWEAVGADLWGQSASTKSKSNKVAMSKQPT